MTQNVGKIDRIIRLVLALILGTLYFTKVVEGEAATWVMAAGFLLFFTSMRRCCPLYAMLGFGTCSIDRKPAEQKVDVKKIDLK